MSINVVELAKKVIKLIPQLVKEDKELAYELYNTLQQYFVPRDLFEKLMEMIREMKEDIKTIKRRQRRHGKILREHSQKLGEHTKILSEHTKILKDHGNTLKWLKSAFMEIKYTMGVRFESVIRRYLERYLRDINLLPKDKKLVAKVIKYEDKSIEINIFCENPLILGEVTAFMHFTDEFRAMIKKFDLVEKILGKKAKMKIVFIGGIDCDTQKEVVKLAKEKGIELIIGEVVEVEL